MRIATWNVNSLSARLAKVTWWLERAEPDVLLMQETKLADADVPRGEFSRLGYEVAHHGVGGWNGVAIASRRGVADVITNFGLPLAAPATSEAPDDEPLREPRMIAAVCGGVRVVSIYAPNGRTVDSIFYRAKLAWFQRMRQWLVETRRADEALIVGGDFNVAPEDADVWDPARCHGGTHVSPPERQAFADLLGWGLDRRVPPAARRARALQLVGLPRRHVPQELRHAHRSPAGHAAGGRTRRVGGDRSRGAQGQADPVRPRAGDHRPRRTGARDRRRLGRRRRAHRRAPPALNGRRTRDAADEDLVNGAVGYRSEKS